MLKKLLTLRHFGIFDNGVPTPANFGRVTLLYAENGRGKSTIATLLRACAAGDATRVLAKTTLDSSERPEVALLFELDGKSVPVAFADGAWNRAVPQLAVFDAEFVEQNVYSGQEVRPEQREALLEFALGEEAVRLRREIGALTDAIAACTSNRADAERRITAICQGMAPPRFIALEPTPDAPSRIIALRRRIDAARSAPALAARQPPTTLEWTSFNIDECFDVLAATLADVERSAETAVAQHFARHSASPGIEAWVSAGQPYLDATTCPFCGQPLEGLALVDAYRAFFGAKYSELKERVHTLAQEVSVALADERIASLSAHVAANAARIEAWRDRLTLAEPVWSPQDAEADIKAARVIAERLALRKQG